MADLDSIGTPTTVSVTTSSAALLPPNPARRGATLFNSGAAVVYVALGFTPTTALYSFQLAANGYYELPFDWAGAVNGIGSASSTVLVTELT